jgi:hypothetical protein
MTSLLNQIIHYFDPNKEGDEEKPSLKKSFDFFKEQTVPRRVQKEDGTYKLLEPGEENENAEFYPVLTTSLEDLSEFGLGIGLYFSTLLALTGLFFVCALILLWTVTYFRSDEYSHGSQEDLPFLLKGSAICDYDPGVCVAVDSSNICILRSDDYPHDGYKMNGCPLDMGQAIADFIMVVFLFGFLSLLGISQDKLAESMDESEQTAQDYSIIVNDPDADAVDPDEWQKFFSVYGHVTYVTVCKNDGPLVQALARKRLILKQIQYEGLKNISIEDLETSSIDRLSTIEQQDDTSRQLLDEPQLEPWKLELQRFGLFRDLRYWFEQLNHVKAEIEMLKIETGKAVKVFVTFEKEEGQRKCLEALTEGLIPAITELSTKITDDKKFRGTNVLHVEEAPEPTDVFYHFLHVDMVTQLKEQLLTYFASFSVIALMASIIVALAESSPGAAAVFISLSNAIVPVLLKIFTSFERHHNATSYQRSLLLKLVIARWMNTAIIIFLTTPHNDTLQEDNLNQIMSILIADAFTTPVLRFIDINTKLQQLFLAPLARTQDKMNTYFTGTNWFLAERYTDMTKTAFVSLVYAAILPQGLFVSVIAFLMCFWVDKFCLLRTWKTPPKVDDRLTKASRGHLALSFWFHILFTMTFWAGHPFDSLCNTGRQTVNGEDIYQKCENSQSSRFLFTPTREWMTDDQKTMVLWYSILSVLMFCVLMVIYFGKEFVFSVLKLFRGDYKPVGEAQNIPYSTVNEIQAYVPQVILPKFTFPLLSTDLSQMDTEQISWSGDWDANNLNSTSDLSGTTLEERNRWFSICRQYPPGGVQELAEEAQLDDEVKTDEINIEMSENPTAETSESNDIMERSADV